MYLKYVLSLVSISSQSVISFVKDVPEKFGLKKSPCDFGNEQLLSVILKTVFLEEKFESQELSLFVDNGKFYEQLKCNIFCGTLYTN